MRWGWHGCRGGKGGEAEGKEAAVAGVEGRKGEGKRMWLFDDDPKTSGSSVSCFLCRYSDPDLVARKEIPVCE